ncbi:MAG: ribonuclease HII [Pyrinomonadaceae bacterium]
MKDTGRIGSNLKDEPDLRVPLFADLHIDSIGLDFEYQARSQGFRLIAGIDEVGRGCLAGSVVAAACILDPSKTLPEGLNDSKQVPQNRRVEMAEEIKANAVAFSFGQVEAEEIDQINILEATKKAMRIAIAGLTPSADFLLIDAVRLKGIDLPQLALIKGDAISFSIAAASVLAKTYRDGMMLEYDERYPQYGFANHVGYGTTAHFDAIKKYGICPLHRKTFRGVV